MPGYGDLHPRFGWPGGANDVAELVEFIRALFKVGYLSEGKKDTARGSASKSSRSRAKETPELVIAGTKRVWEEAWAHGLRRKCRPATDPRSPVAPGVTKSRRTAWIAPHKSALRKTYKELTGQFDHWEKTKDLIDQFLDIILNYRQSGHPGGSRSKVHALLVTLLERRDALGHPPPGEALRRPLRPGRRAHHPADLLHAGACSTRRCGSSTSRPATSATWCPRRRSGRSCWEDLLGFRRRGGLSGHAEMEGKTLFLKFNTGPSGHGSPAAAGEALALKRAGAEGVKVFAFEGEGGLTPGAAHETMNSAWGLALDNLYFVVDWNDFGIDDHPVSTVVLRHARGLVRLPRLARVRRRAGQRVGAGDAGDAGDGVRREPDAGAERGLVQDAQGPRLPEVRQRRRTARRTR